MIVICALHLYRHVDTTTTTTTLRLQETSLFGFPPTKRQQRLCAHGVAWGVLWLCLQNQAAAAAAAAPIRLAYRVNQNRPPPQQQ
jgi:hypothetical protein